MRLSPCCRNAIVPPHPSDMASSLSDTESLDTLGLAPSSPYTASLQPLRQGQASPTAALLAPDALLEQFERAQQYVARHPEDFSLERLSSLQARPKVLTQNASSGLNYAFSCPLRLLSLKVKTARRSQTLHAALTTTSRSARTLQKHLMCWSESRHVPEPMYGQSQSRSTLVRQCDDQS